MDLVDRQKSEQTTEEGTQEKNDGPKQKAFSGNHNSNGRTYVLPIWIRPYFCNYNETNKFFLDYGLSFLLPFGSILYVTFFLFS